MTLLRTDGERYIPTDYRIYSKSVGNRTENDRFRAMLRTAAQRGFRPEAVLFDSRYSGPENLELIRSLGRRRPTLLKYNRQAVPDRPGNRPVGPRGRYFRTGRYCS
ncbi:MAG: hypothetical protein GY820_12605, partial [Gammaproteobacteria bacterium]|nr:hypothetical protein [Gammaproteobacteria bacterium]